MTMAGLGAKDILRNVSALEQLIEEINFQRAKEMRQCLMSKDSDTGFVVVHGTTYWTDLFVRHFLFQTDRSTDADDLLFFIRKKPVRGSRHIPKYQTEVEVYRKDSRKLPIGDPDIDWEETVYLNLIIHQFDYTLTLAVCTRTSPKDLQVLRRHSQKVYASPSRRRMDTKGEVEEITYPNVCFHVDNFDEVFGDMQVRDGEMVCVELVAADHSGDRQAVIFLGSIRYDALKRVYDARASLSSKVAQRMMLGLFSGSSNQRIEFVRMKGPQGKGHAEMAVTKPKGSGVETPTSEPGMSLTDLWDTDWEDEPEDRIMYKHQRRLSDPSANFNTFINSGWRARGGVAGQDGGRSRSENEGLDSFADGLYEIESGDVRDAAAACAGRCCITCGNAVSQQEQLDQKLQQDSVNMVDSFRCSNCQHYHSCNSEEQAAEIVVVSTPVSISTGVVQDAVTNVAASGLDQSLLEECTLPPISASITCTGDSMNASNITAEISSLVVSEPGKSTVTPTALTTAVISSTCMISSQLISEECHLSSPEAIDRIVSDLKSSRCETNKIVVEKGSTLINDEFLEETEFNDSSMYINSKCNIKQLKSKENSLLDEAGMERIHSKNYAEDSSFELVLESECAKPDEDYEEAEEFEPLLSGPGMIHKIRSDVESIPAVEVVIPGKKTSVKPFESVKLNKTNECKGSMHDLVHSRSCSSMQENVASIYDKDSTKSCAAPCADSHPTEADQLNYNTLPRTKETMRGVKMPGTAVRVAGRENIFSNAEPSDEFIENAEIKRFSSLRKRQKKKCIKGSTVLYKDFPVDSEVGTEALADDDFDDSGEAVTMKPLLGTAKQRRKITIPYKITQDGTKVNFFNEVKLDDGAYNPLWSTRGFTQTFHFWKENRRAQSVPFNAYLTYVTLPWYNIITDILDHETGPILTF